ncbi:GDP-mannose 4,6-dehydratase [Methanobacterium spitsbergense]|uniref:GDP-mannose 4,6-dehydratase n=1 Tax=Methanobacterium spitsbergense TaxID=2874285 RepID=A0A8T5V3S9_9EURY|nr:GDP-mannose 4,6-dehydratase [Methanobacterium spitsbergense]MBZ2166315.1 GDP-mannose 4,6-dehydratase [Methanobacterium spitsbergense]
MKALVTGCAGFIGSHLTEKLLEQDYDVIGIDCFTDYYSNELKRSNISNSLKNNNFTLIEEDITTLTEFPDVDYIFHLAGQPGVRKSWGQTFETYTKDNIYATQRLLEFYKDLDIIKFVYSSSSSVYGDVELPMSEDRVLKPISPYGVTKLAAEHLSYLYQKNYDLPTISLRYFSVYGPRQRPDMAINKFIKAIIEGKEIHIYGDGTQTRDFTFISDVVNANIIAAKGDIIGDFFNIGGGSNISVNDLIGEIEQITGIKAKIRYDSEQKGDVKDTLSYKNKAENILGWKSSVGIEKGLEIYIKWYYDFLENI